MGGSKCKAQWLVPLRARTRASLVIEKELNIDYLNAINLDDLSATEGKQSNHEGSRAERRSSYSYATNTSMTEEKEEEAH